MADKKLAAPAAKKALPTEVTPVGIASFAHLLEPDSKGQYADDKYKITLKLPKQGADNQSEIDAFVAKINKAADEAFPKSRKRNDSPVKDGDAKEHESNHGFWLLTFKTNYQPPMVDTKKTPLPKEVKIFAGDVVRVAYAIKEYETKAVGTGVSLQLRAVQLIEKRAASSKAASAFDEIDGFEAAATKPESAGGVDGDF